MPEKANAPGNAGDRVSNFDPHRKMADFRRVLTDKSVAKGLNKGER
jgi:hypothetical protein